jgi:hypothetical protein
MFKQPEIGCRHPTFDAPKPKLKPVALVQLIATATLVLSTLIVATAVTIGLARVEFAPSMTGAAAAPFAITHSHRNRAA